MQLSFGSGALWGERTDQTGSGIGPRQFGLIQDVQINVDFTEKELYGQFQFAQVVARGQGKITGTAKYAQILGLLYSDLFFGEAAAVGQFSVSQLEANFVPSLTPFQFNVAHGASYNDDLGVTYATTGKSFNRVTSPTTTGQYAVNAATGTYTFSVADAGASVLVAYTYLTGGTGRKITITNQLMGVTPTFKATFYNTYGGSGTSLRLNACTASKLSLPTKIDNWTIFEFSFSAFADASGTVGYLSTVE